MQLDAAPKPTIPGDAAKAAIRIASEAGLAGETMVRAMMAVGYVGLLSNGPSRDVDAIRRLRFRLLLSGITAGHREMAVQALNVPISVGGMDVAPGELVQMIENGAVKFPTQHTKAVLHNASVMLAEEATRLAKIRSATIATAVRAANGGTPYTPKKD
jgi:4-hydroxy-4-methyl-2-oxoglutarate aldolase